MAVGVIVWNQKGIKTHCRKRPCVSRSLLLSTEHLVMLRIVLAAVLVDDKRRCVVVDIDRPSASNGKKIPTSLASG